MKETTLSNQPIEPLKPHEMAEILSKASKPDAEKVYQMIASLASTVKVKVYKSKFLSEDMIVIGTAKTSISENPLDLLRTETPCPVGQKI